jgi:hypothetical protein
VFRVEILTNKRKAAFEVVKKVAIQFETRERAIAAAKAEMRALRLLRTSGRADLYDGNKMVGYISPDPDVHLEARIAADEAVHALQAALESAALAMPAASKDRAYLEHRRRTARQIIDKLLTVSNSDRMGMAR